jgi:hypothetical protein
MNSIPIIGWLAALAFTASLAVPFWLCWTICGIGATFFPFLPTAYVTIGFFQSIGLFTSLGIVKQVCLRGIFNN